MTWSGLSGLAVVNVSDWVTLGKLSVPVIRSTSVLPNARGAVRLLTSLKKCFLPPEVEALPPSDRPQKIITAPARKFSCLSMTSRLTLEQSNATGTRGSMEDCVVTLYFCCACAAAGRAGFAVANSASEMPASATNAPIKTRGLKNADCEVDFFFISGVEVDGI